MNIIKDLVDYIAKIFTWWVVVMPWEQAIRVTFGKNQELLNKGIYIKLPLVHTIYVQERRLRVINLPVQTISTKDGHAITLSLAVGYSIEDLVLLYNTLYQPDLTISNILASKVAGIISSRRLEDCIPSDIEKELNGSINETNYGLKYEYVNIINFAHVKTFRLIQDQSYQYEGLDMFRKK